MKTKLPLLIAIGLGAIVLGTPAGLLAKGKKKPASEASASPAATAAASEKKARPVPYHGKVASVDASAKTFTVGKRTITVTDETVITKAGASATMADIVADEQVRGSYRKKEDGTLAAKTVKLGPKTDAEKPVTDAQKKEGTEAADPSASPKP